MSYCTLTDLTNQFSLLEMVQLTDRTNLGVVNNSVLAAAVARADLTINRSLGGRALPVPAGDVVDLACDITRYYLHEDQPTPAVRMRFEDALAQLKLLAANKSSLVDAAGNPGPVDNNVSIVPGRITDMSGFI